MSPLIRNKVAPAAIWQSRRRGKVIYARALVSDGEGVYDVTDALRGDGYLAHDGEGVADVTDTVPAAADRERIIAVGSTVFVD